MEFKNRFQKGETVKKNLCPVSFCPVLLSLCGRYIWVSSDCCVKALLHVFCCVQAFTVEGDQIHSVPSLRYYSNNNSHARFLTSNTEQDIHRLQGELTQLRQEIQKKEQVKVTLVNNLRKNQNEEKKCETQLMKIGQRLNKFQNVSTRDDVGRGGGYFHTFN